MNTRLVDTTEPATPISFSAVAGTKILHYPETRQVYSFDCGANALVSFLVYAGIEEREDRVAALAGTTTNGTSTSGIISVLDYYGLPYRAKEHMTINDLKDAIDEGHPTLLTLQAYRESGKLYRLLWTEGHWVVNIGYGPKRKIFEDPASFHRTWLGDEELMQRWHDKDKKKVIQWGCTLLVKGVYQPGFMAHMD